MAADLTQVRQNYALNMQQVCKLVVQLNGALANLDALYQGGGLSGTFTDAELAGAAGTKHLVAADVGTFTANLQAIQTAITLAILRNMAKAVGTLV